MDFSTDHFLNSSQNGGLHSVLMATRSTAATAATITSGYTTATHCPETITIPAFGGDVSGAYMTQCKTIFGANAASMTGVELTLGTLTISGNVFAAGTAMPTRIVARASVIAASIAPFLLVTAALTATTPVITITYTNQAGTASRSAALTLPTNAALNSIFFIAPHLQAGDTGIRSVQNISTSAGSAGSLTVVGFTPLLFDGTQTESNISASALTPLIQPVEPVRLVAGELIGITVMSSAAADDIYSSMCFAGDV